MKIFRPMQLKWLVSVFLVCMPTVVWAQDLVSTITNILVQNTQVTYALKVCNQGYATVGNSQLALYYHLASAPGCSTSPSYVWNIDSLGPSDCVTIQHVRKDVPLGSYTAWSRADYNCAVSETNNDNNNASKEYQVLPDLWLESLEVATGGSSGNGAVYRAKIKNLGATTTDTFVLALYFNRTSAPGCNITPDVFWVIDGLAYNESVEYKSPRENVPTGNFTAWAMVDQSCIISETNESNNISSGISYSVGPNIHIYKPQVTVNGSTVTYKVKVANNGTMSTGPFAVGLWYNRTSNPVCNTAANYVWPVSNLASNGQYTELSYEITNVSGGSYTAYAFADMACAITEMDETDNIDSSSYTVSFPDFYMKEFSAISNGNQVTFSAKVCNQGATTSIPFQIGLYYNLSSKPTCASSPDFTWPPINGLTPGDGNCITLTPYTMTGVAAGAYHAWVLADRTCLVPESDENNNDNNAFYSVAATQPDLNVSAFSATPNGTTVTYNALINNSGLSTSAPFYIGLYFNRATAPDCSIKPDVEFIRPNGLANGDPQLVTYVQNNATPGGPYTGWMMIDNRCQITEYNETNNTASSAPYTIASPTQPDLVVESFDVNAVGTSVTYTAKICNKGTANSPTVTVGLFYNRTNAPAQNCTDAPNAIATVGALAPNGCETKTWTQTNTPPNTYNAWVFADSTCQASESREDNNHASKSYTVTSVAPDLGIAADGGTKFDSQANIDYTITKPDSEQKYDQSGNIKNDIKIVTSDQSLNSDAQGVQPDGSINGDGPFSSHSDGGVVTGGDNGILIGEAIDGCSCEVANHSTSHIAWWLFLGIGIIMFRIRRRKMASK